MTGSTSPAIDTVVAQWNTGHERRVVDALKNDPQLVAEVRAEITRLETQAPRRYLLHPDRGDAVSKKLYKALTAMIEALT